jgi:lysophospholipase L1-like esterase
MALAATAGVAYVLSKRHPKLTEDSRVLVVGDSMAVGLTPYLRSMAEEAGLPFQSLRASGTTITYWAHNQDLVHALDSFEPTIVLVVLGTNDEYLSEANLAAEADDLAELLALFEGIDVAWVGVPSLPRPESNGAVALIESTGVPYFPSDRLDIPRGPDNLHPTVAGYGMWAGSVWSWLL